MTTASESGAFLACIPVVALIMSSLILKEWPSRWQVVGVITTLIGIIIAVFAAGGSTHFSLVGYLILGLAVVSYALYCVDVERASQFSSLEITYFMLASGCLTFGLFERALAPPCEQSKIHYHYPLSRLGMQCSGLSAIKFCHRKDRS